MLLFLYTIYCPLTLREKAPAQEGDWEDAARGAVNDTAPNARKMNLPAKVSIEDFDDVSAHRLKYRS